MGSEPYRTGYDGGGKLLAEYVYANGQRIAKMNAGGDVDYYLNDHLGSTRQMSEGSMARDYYPFGEAKVASGDESNYLFTGKELDANTGLQYFGARYYDASIGRFLSVDPHADSYPSWTPYNYAANNPLIIIDPDGKDWYDMGNEKEADIQWRDGSDEQLKPGFWNKIKSFFGKGEYAESLGANVLVGYGTAPDVNNEINEEVNGATFGLYLESDKTGPTATINGNTISSDPSSYATIAAGLNTAELTTYHGNPALIINGGGRVATIGNNPNPESNFYGQNGADGIYFHAGNSDRASLTTWGGDPISTGCQTASHGNRQAYLNFMNNFRSGWTGNYYLIRR